MKEANDDGEQGRIEVEESGRGKGLKLTGVLIHTSQLSHFSSCQVSSPSPPFSSHFSMPHTLHSTPVTTSS
ncbi:hypothetical protein Pmani_013946 [Petrolisthes manimaculis]|uniref:Uncharacterized protein n=1 Tax=Petrolisthes manimaculis TaxID=1843537 RepID=A0AAE1PVC0_9EUCA|nr:hypothetical protein Pmani_013946 [Petrolisthes manimaculis]